MYVLDDHLVYGFVVNNQNHIKQECGIDVEYLANGAFASVHTPKDDNASVIYSTWQNSSVKWSTMFHFDLIQDILWCDYSAITDSWTQITLRVKKLENCESRATLENDPIFHSLLEIFGRKMCEHVNFDTFLWCEHIPIEFFLDLATCPELEGFEYLRMWAQMIYTQHGDCRPKYDFKESNWLYDKERDQYLPIDGIYA